MNPALKLCSLAPLLLAAAACAPAASEPDPQQRALDLLDAHVAAVGGEDAYAALENLRTEVDIVEQGATVRGDYRAARDGRMRIDVYYDGERFFSEGIDADGVWQQAGEGAPVETVTGDPADRLRRGVVQRFESLSATARGGTSLRYAGTEKRDGKTFETVEVTGIDGHVRTYFFDPDSALATRMQEREALHPDADPTENDEEEVRSGFESHCGILQPTKTRVFNRETGAELQSTTLLSNRCNLAEDELDLARPE